MKMLNMDDGGGAGRSPRDQLESLFRHKKKAGLFFIVVLITALIVLAFTPEKYTSNAKLIVRGERESIFLDSVTDNNASRPLRKEWENEVNSELEILGSRELLHAVALSLGADFILSSAEASGSGRLSPIREMFDPARQALLKLRKPGKRGLAESAQSENTNTEDKAIELLEKKITIEGRESSDIILISCEADSPEKAQAILSNLIGTYLEERIEILRIPGAYEFFTQQTEQLLDELKQTEAAITALKREAGISSLDDSSGLEKMIESVRTQYLDIQSSMAASNARIALLKRQLKQPVLPDVPSPSEEIKEIISEMEESRQQEELALVQFISAPPASAKQEPAIVPVEETHPEPPPPKTHSTLDHEEYKVLLSTLHEEEGIQSALRAEEFETRQQLVLLREELAEINKALPPIRSLARERELIEEKYRKFSASKEQARINQELEMKRISNVSIVQHASLPSRADPSGKLFKLFAAIFLGMGGSITLAFSASVIDPKLHSAFDISKRLGLTTLAELPRMPKHALDPSHEPPRSKRGFLALFIKSCEPKPGAFDDCFTDLYYKLLALRDPEQPEPFVIGITSSTVGEGVTTIATYLAAALARDGAFSSTLLMDSNPELHPNRLVQKMNDVPFTYRHIKDIRNTDESEDRPLYAVACIDDLTLAKNWEYEIIVVDIPPVLSEDAAIRLTAAVDLAVLTIDAGRIPWRTAQRSVELLTNAQAQLAGTILNRKQVTMPKWLYQKL